MSLLSCPNDIFYILVFLVPDMSAKKYVNEYNFIIRPIYPSWLIKDVSQIIIIIIIIIRLSTTG